MKNFIENATPAEIKRFKKLFKKINQYGGDSSTEVKVTYKNGKNSKNSKTLMLVVTNPATGYPLPHYDIDTHKLSVLKKQDIMKIKLYDNDKKCEPENAYDPKDYLSELLSQDTPGLNKNPTIYRVSGKCEKARYKMNFGDGRVSGEFGPFVLESIDKLKKDLGISYKQKENFSKIKCNLSRWKSYDETGHPSQHGITSGDGFKQINFYTNDSINDEYVKITIDTIPEENNLILIERKGDKIPLIQFQIDEIDKLREHLRIKKTKDTFEWKFLKRGDKKPHYLYFDNPNFSFKAGYTYENWERERGTHNKLISNYLYIKVRAHFMPMAASQFNCLEMGRDTFTPDVGIACYKEDRTQGPLCAIACPIGTLMRNYAMFHDLKDPNYINFNKDKPLATGDLGDNIAQSSKIQIDCFKPVTEQLNLDGVELQYEYRNGYIKMDADNIKVLSDALNNYAGNNGVLIEKLRKKISQQKRTMEWMQEQNLNTGLKNETKLLDTHQDELNKLLKHTGFNNLFNSSLNKLCLGIQHDTPVIFTSFNGLPEADNITIDGSKINITKAGNITQIYASAMPWLYIQGAEPNTIKFQKNITRKLMKAITIISVLTALKKTREINSTVKLQFNFPGSGVFLNDYYSICNGTFDGFQELDSYWVLNGDIHTIQIAFNFYDITGSIIKASTTNSPDEKKKKFEQNKDNFLRLKDLIAYLDTLKELFK